MEKRCELCGKESSLVFTVVVSLDSDEDNCIRNSAEVCAECLFFYDNNIEVMVAVNERRIQIEEEKYSDYDCAEW